MKITLGNKIIGVGLPCVIVAEIGVNHNGDPELAMRMIEAAANAGADIVKFQAYTAERLVSRNMDQAAHQNGEQTVLELLKSLDLPDESYARLMMCCRDNRVGFLCSPFDEERVDFLVRLGVDGFKVGSGELTNYPFLRHMGAKKLPVILSTGMSTLSETGLALEALAEAGTEDVVLLHCLSSYPADPAQANLKSLHTLREAFALPVGFSDHSVGDTLAVATRALGAAVLEKHFTLDTSMPGPDQKASMEPKDFRAMVDKIRMVETALGNGIKTPASSEAELRLLARRSLAAARDIMVGEVLTREDLVTLRPGGGIPPAYIELIIGRKTSVDVRQGTLFNLEYIE